MYLRLVPTVRHPVLPPPREGRGERSSCKSGSPPAKRRRRRSIRRSRTRPSARSNTRGSSGSWSGRPRNAAGGPKASRASRTCSPAARNRIPRTPSTARRSRRTLSPLPAPLTNSRPKTGRRPRTLTSSRRASFPPSSEVPCSAACYQTIQASRSPRRKGS